MNPSAQTHIERATPVAAADRYFTVFVDEEIFGLSVQNVQTIFRISTVTPIPQGPKDIVGVVNLRGKIVTAVSLRRRLKMPDDRPVTNALAIGIEHKRNESFALIVDGVGDVLCLDNSMQIPIPPHFDPERARLTKGLYRVGDLLVPVLDIDVVFDLGK